HSLTEASEPDRNVSRSRARVSSLVLMKAIAGFVADIASTALVRTGAPAEFPPVGVREVNCAPLPFVSDLELTKRSSAPIRNEWAPLVKLTLSVNVKIGDLSRRV